MHRLNGYEVILASGSPRRKAFFEKLGIPFKIEVYPVDESFPSHLKGIEITLYNTENLKSLSKTLLDKRQDALVIGHSNTTGVLAGLLANDEIEDIDLDVYDHIYQLVICGKSRRLNLFKSSFKCDT